MNLEVYQFGPENIAMLGSFMAECLSKMPPNEAQTLFAAIIANLAANIPDQQWEEMKAVAKLPCECGDPDCGKTVQVLMDAGDVARVYFKKCKPEPSNPDEKGFPE